LPPALTVTTAPLSPLVGRGALLLSWSAVIVVADAIPVPLITKIELGPMPELGNPAGIMLELFSIAVMVGGGALLVVTVPETEKLSVPLESRDPVTVPEAVKVELERPA